MRVCFLFKDYTTLYVLSAYCCEISGSVLSTTAIILSGCFFEFWIGSYCVCRVFRGNVHADLQSYFVSDNAEYVGSAEPALRGLPAR